ncbi:MAG: M23 family metallopeptidase [Treponema sp.]|nr:M23 family metallopeptidase [Treponema sp.]
MAAIIEKQQISKRRKTTASRLNNKSAGFNYGFMSQFRQKPIHIKRSKKVFSFLKPPTRREESRKTKNTGFSFPLPSIKTLAVIAGIVIIAFAAFNFEDLDIRMPTLDEIQLTGDYGVEHRLSHYAITGISSIFGEITENPDTSAVDNILTETDDPQGMLFTFEWQQYRVQRGDSVSGIAQKHKVSIGAIIASNNISNARRLQEGAILRIPNIDGIPYQIQRGDNLSKISASFNIPLEVILDVNDIKSDNIKPGETIFIPGARMNDIDLRLSLGELFMYPLQTRFITSGYGMRRDPKTGVSQFHSGIDFRANIGVTVMASLDGTVSFVGENWLYGKFIIISHSNGYKTLYAHLNSFAVKQGDRVARGRKIGEVGNTGYSTGPHLHFEIIDKNGKFVNPLELLN